MCACVCSYCLILLLGNTRVTLWCNHGYEHISQSPRLESEGKARSPAITEVRRGERRGPASPLTSALPSCCLLLLLPHATVIAGASAILFHFEQWLSWKFTERSSQLFPIFVGLFPLRAYEWTPRSQQTLLWDQNTDGWPVEVSEAGRRTNLAASKVVCGEMGGYCYCALLFWDGSERCHDKTTALFFTDVFTDVMALLFWKLWLSQFFFFYMYSKWGKD